MPGARTAEEGVRQAEGRPGGDEVRAGGTRPAYCRKGPGDSG